jgi:electron transport complex protein RnfC
MDVPETVDAKDIQPVTTSALEDAAREVFGEPEGAPAGEPEKAEEPAKPAEKAEDPRIASRLLAAKRAELRSAQERAELNSIRADIERQKAELAQYAKLADQIKAAKGSPSKLMELAELEPKAFLESLANEHEPQAIAQRVRTEVQSEVEALRKQVAELQASREQEVAALKAQQAEAQVESAQRVFLDHVATQADAYPNRVEEYTPSEIAKEALAVARKHGQDYFTRFGEWPDDSVIAEYLEGQAKARAEERAAWRGRIGKPAPQPGKGDSSGETRSRPTVRADSPRTLTSRAASAKATPAREWSQEDADAEALRILESAYSSKRAV